MKRRLALAALAPIGLVLAAGCGAEDRMGGLIRLGMPEPASDRAHHVLSLWQGAWIAAFAVGALVWGLIIWAVIAYRKRGDALPVQTRYHMPIEALYTAVPVVIIAVLFYFTVRDQNAILDVDKDNPPEHVVTVVGQQWSWTFNYNSKDAIGDNVWESGTPEQLPTLYLPEGEKVGFKLTTPDVIHSFFVPAFLFKMDVMPGKTNYFELTPDKAGEFEGKCAELCGAYHSRMLFTVKVVPKDQYTAHLRKLQGEGQTGKAEGAKIEQPGLEQEHGAGEENMSGSAK